jgi:hypothetical protein
VGKIILPDENGAPPMTWADDSYAPSLSESTVTVVAQFPNDADMTWHLALLTQFGRTEVKYRDYSRGVGSLPSDLVRRVMHGVRRALIIISDDSEHRREMTSDIENLTRTPFTKMAPNLQSYFGNVVSNFADEMVLLYSPLPRIGDFLGLDEDDVWKYKAKLENPRNVRVFACRTTGAFAEIVDPSLRAKAVGQLEEIRYFDHDRSETQLMRSANVPTRVFDEGNKKVTDIIRKLRRSVHKRLESTDYLLVPEPLGETTEATSSLVRQVGASDIAAGLARALYESSDGRTKVADAFDRVILNGHLIRS